MYLALCAPPGETPEQPSLIASARARAAPPIACDSRPDAAARTNDCAGGEVTTLHRARERHMDIARSNLPVHPRCAFPASHPDEPHRKRYTPPPPQTPPSPHSPPIL